MRASFGAVLLGLLGVAVLCIGEPNVRRELGCPLRRAGLPR